MNISNVYKNTAHWCRYLYDNQLIALPEDFGAGMVNLEKL